MPCVGLFEIQPSSELVKNGNGFLSTVYNNMDKLEGCVIVSKTNGRPLCKLKCNWYNDIHRACGEMKDST